MNDVPRFTTSRGTVWHSRSRSPVSSFIAFFLTVWEAFSTEYRGVIKQMVVMWMTPLAQRSNPNLHLSGCDLCLYRFFIFIKIFWLMSLQRRSSRHKGRYFQPTKWKRAYSFSETIQLCLFSVCLIHNVFPQRQETGITQKISLCFIRKWPSKPGEVTRRLHHDLTVHCSKSVSQ